MLNNIIGLTAGGTTVLGNDQAGVADTSPGTVIGPGNVISANLIGVLISGAAATGVIVIGNLIGTDSTGEADLGNAEAGVEIDDASGTIVEGNGQGSQVISGNLVGVEIDGSTSTQNLVEGNLIGTDKSGTADRGNSNEGILIEGAAGNTVGGTTAAARNVISANQWGIRIDGPTATGNLIEGNDVGTDITGTLPWATRSTASSSAMTPRTTRSAARAAARGIRSLSTWRPGSSSQSGTGDSILSNSIFSNGQQGIALARRATIRRALRRSPGRPAGAREATSKGRSPALPNTSFLIQFFSSLVPDPSGFGQGQTFLGSTIVTTDAGGSATINFNLASGLAIGTWVTVTATNETTGDTSGFSNAVSAQPVSIAFAMA